MSDFNYIDHYKKDAVEFDYFAQRKGATSHDERRAREFIISKISKNVNSILDVGCGNGWVAKEFLPKGKKVYSLDISITNPIKVKNLYPDEKHFGITADSFHLLSTIIHSIALLLQKLLSTLLNRRNLLKSCFVL